MNVVVFASTKLTKYSSLMLDDWLNNRDVEDELYEINGVSTIFKLFKLNFFDYF